MADQSQTQQVLQNLTGVHSGAQPNAGATNNGNPNTAYNVAPQSSTPQGPVFIPPQANAQGQWWSPPAQPLNPLIASIIANTYGRYQPGAPGPVVLPPPTTQPPVVVPEPEGGTGTFPPGRGNRGYWEDMGGDGSYCVSKEMVLEGSVKAEKAVVGLVATTHTPEEGFDLHAIEAVGEPIKQPCVLIVTERNAMLVCSVSTPFTMVGAQSDDQTILAPAMKGELVYVKRGKKTKIEKVVEVLDAGVQLVVPISFGGRSFPAGADKSALIYSHNIRKIPGTGMDLISLYDSLNERFGVSWGDTEYITTAGQLAGMNPYQAANYAGGNAYLPGGNLYTGGNVQLPGTPTQPGQQAPATQTPPSTQAPPATQQPPSGNWFTRLMQSLGVSTGSFVPRDRDGTVDWQGLLLEMVGGPLAGAIDTRGQPTAPAPAPVALPNTNYGPQP